MIGARKAAAAGGVPDDGVPGSGVAITDGGTTEPLVIGQVAEAVGVSERTLRYYEEIGLVVPSRRSPGGYRHYMPGDVERIVRVRELQEVMGYSLEEIQAIFAARDRFEAIRNAYRKGPAPEEQARLLDEAMAMVESQRQRVRAKVGRLERILADLDERAKRYRRIRAEMTAARPSR